VLIASLRRRGVGGRKFEFGVGRSLVRL